MIVLLISAGSMCIDSGNYLFGELKRILKAKRAA